MNPLTAKIELAQKHVRALAKGKCKPRSKNPETTGESRCETIGFLDEKSGGFATVRNNNQTTESIALDDSL